MNAKRLGLFLSLCVAVGLHHAAWSANVPVPSLPSWMKEMPSTPEWWLSTELNTNGISKSNWTARVWETKALIRDQVGKGMSATRQRREFIRHMSFLIDCPWVSSSDREELKGMVAETYSRLMDHRRSARQYAEILEHHPNRRGIAHGLAIEYERLGETDQAIKLYGFMSQKFAEDKLYAEIAKRGMAVLSGTKRDCPLKKPSWWEQFAQVPEWWTEVQVPLPQTNSYPDGVQFVAQTVLKDADLRKLVKAEVELSDLFRLTVSEKIEVLMDIAGAYSRIGDHHRAIESAWGILERFSGDSRRCSQALTFIASQFDKLGESDNAQAARKALPCFEEK